MASQRIVHTLAEITGSLGRCIKQFYGTHRCAKAEIAKLNLFRNGNCYPELVQTENGKNIASCKGVIWSRIYNKINKKFIETVGSPLSDGMTVEFEFYILFDNRRGISLIITDIDIDSVIGESTRAKIDTINSLKSQGIFALNKNLTEPRLIQRVAVISVSTGKGYADFSAVINDNHFGYNYFVPLFSAAMVGDRAAAEISAQLHNIAAKKHLFDAVAIIRGGGGDVSLAFFNNYELAKAVAEFPLPVFTGIGHATNTTAVEEVAHHSFSTPSELANYIINKTHQAELNLDTLVKTLHQKMSAVVMQNRSHLNAVSRTIKIHITNILINNKLKLGATTQHIHTVITQRLNENRRYRLTMLVRDIASSIKSISTNYLTRLDNIELALTQRQKRNNGDIYIGGTKVTSVSQLQPGSMVEITLNGGVVTAEIKSIKEEKLS